MSSWSVKEEPWVSNSWVLTYNYVIRSPGFKVLGGNWLSKGKHRSWPPLLSLLRFLELRAEGSQARAANPNSQRTEIPKGCSAHVLLTVTPLSFGSPFHSLLKLIPDVELRSALSSYSFEIICLLLFFMWWPFNMWLELNPHPWSFQSWTNYHQSEGR